MINATTHEWITLNGCNGYALKSKNSNRFIFLPASSYTGTGSVNHPMNPGTEGFYWTQTLDSNYADEKDHTWVLQFHDPTTPDIFNTHTLSNVN